MCGHPVNLASRNLYYRHQRRSCSTAGSHEPLRRCASTAGCRTKSSASHSSSVPADRTQTLTLHELTFAPLELRCPGAPGYRGTLCHPRGKGLASLRRSSVLLQVACDRSPAGHPTQSVGWVRRTRRLIPYRSDPSQMSPSRYPTRQLPHHNPLKTWVHWCGTTFQIS